MNVIPVQGSNFGKKIPQDRRACSSEYLLDQKILYKTRVKMSIFFIKDIIQWLRYFYSIEKHKTAGLVRSWVYWPDAKITSPGPAVQWYFEPCCMVPPSVAFGMCSIRDLHGTQASYGLNTFQAQVIMHCVIATWQRPLLNCQSQKNISFVYHFLCISCVTSFSP